MEPAFLFVYGALMRGCELHQHMERASFVGDGATRGKLFSFGRYPGLVDGDGWVRGELYRFDDMPAALDILDDIEDYNPVEAERSLYIRAARQVRMDDGRVVDAWVYVFNGSADGAALIAGGDWRVADT